MWNIIRDSSLTSDLKISLKENFAISVQVIHNSQIKFFLSSYQNSSSGSVAEVSTYG